jgi:acyl carrier protein
MFEKIQKIMSSVFEIEAKMINENSSADTIAVWDSLKHINLIMALEQEFNVEFDEVEISEMISYKEIEKALKSKVS